MGTLFNVLYAILTWLAAFAVGLGSWLGWALLAMAVFQSFCTLVAAVTGE